MKKNIAKNTTDTATTVITTGKIPPEQASPTVLINRLSKAIQHGVEFICEQLENLGPDTDPNDVVKWLKDSYAMAENVISFHKLISGEKEENVRGGAKINKFELPS